MWVHVKKLRYSNSLILVILLICNILKDFSSSLTDLLNDIAQLLENFRPGAKAKNLGIVCKVRNIPPPSQPPKKVFFHLFLKHRVDLVISTWWRKPLSLQLSWEREMKSYSKLRWYTGSSCLEFDWLAATCSEFALCVYVGFGKALVTVWASSTQDSLLFTWWSPMWRETGRERM